MPSTDRRAVPRSWRRSMSPHSLQPPMTRQRAFLGPGPAVYRPLPASCAGPAPQYACRAPVRGSLAEHEPDHQCEQSCEHHPDRDHQPATEATPSGLHHVRGATGRDHREHRIASESLAEVIRGDHAARGHRAATDHQDHCQRQEGVHQQELPGHGPSLRVGHAAKIRRPAAPGQRGRSPRCPISRCAQRPPRRPPPLPAGAPGRRPRPPPPPVRGGP